MLPQIYRISKDPWPPAEDMKASINLYSVNASFLYAIHCLHTADAGYLKAILDKSYLTLGRKFNHQVSMLKMILFSHKDIRAIVRYKIELEAPCRGKPVIGDKQATLSHGLIDVPFGRLKIFKYPSFEKDVYIDCFQYEII